MPTKRISTVECECCRCGYKWRPKSDKLPVICAKCKSPYWNVPKQKGTP